MGTVGGSRSRAGKTTNNRHGSVSFWKKARHQWHGDRIPRIFSFPKKKGANCSSLRRALLPSAGTASGALALPPWQGAQPAGQSSCDWDLAQWLIKAASFILPGNSAQPEWAPEPVCGGNVFLGSGRIQSGGWLISMTIAPRMHLAWCNGQRWRGSESLAAEAWSGCSWLGPFQCMKFLPSFFLLEEMVANW